MTSPTTSPSFFIREARFEASESLIPLPASSISRVCPCSFLNSADLFSDVRSLSLFPWNVDLLLAFMASEKTLSYESVDRPIASLPQLGHFFSVSRSLTLLSSSNSQQWVQTATRKVSRILTRVDWRSSARSLSGETISPLLLISSTPILAIGESPSYSRSFTSLSPLFIFDTTLDAHRRRSRRER